MRLNGEKLERLVEILDTEIEAGRLPGASLAVGIGEETAFRTVRGYAENLRGVVRPAQSDTMYDLASLTKVTATLPSILALIDDGFIRLNDPVSRFIPEFSEGKKADVRLKHLITHTSGLAPFRLFYTMYDKPEDVLQAVKSDPLEDEIGQHVVYSDIGFILLGEIVRVVTGKTIAEFATDRIFRPLGMNDTMYCPPESQRSRIAATEANGPGGTVKVGIVHDENADSLGGVAGHAGLFSTLDDMIKYAQMWTSDENPVLSSAARRASAQCHTEGLDGRRGLGWTARYDGYDHTGDLWPVTTVAHTGFTGTSIALDLPSKLWCVVLTNDVHYGRVAKHIIRLRPILHNVVAASVEDWDA